MSNLHSVSNRYNRERGSSGGGHYDLSKSTIYPVAGALLGTCLGGPVGMLAGVKIGGLAAIGGSVFGEFRVARWQNLTTYAKSHAVEGMSFSTLLLNLGVRVAQVVFQCNFGTILQ